MTGRDRIVVIVLLVAGLIAGGWFLLLAPQRDQADGLAGQIASERQARDGALQDIAAGLAAKAQYAHDYATVARLGAAVPDDDNVASLIVQIQSAANAAHVDFRSLKTGGGSGASAPAPSPPSTATPGAPATQTAAATLPPGAAVGTAGFPTMPFSFEFTGSFFHLADFVGRLQRFLVVTNRRLAVNGRFMTLDGIALNAAPKGFPLIAANVAATTYLLPSGEGLTNGATATGPSTASTPAAGAASGSSPVAPAAATPPVR